MEWPDIAELVNSEFRDDDSEYRSEAAYRKPYQQAKRFYEAGVFDSLSHDKYLGEIRAAQQEVRKEKQRLFDERTALNRLLREQSRKESMVDVVRKAIEEFRSPKFEYTPHIVTDSDNDLIIHLTDIHCGMDIDNAFNRYDADVLNERLKCFLDEIHEIRDLYSAQNAYLILGGDLIHGLIHVNSRIESKENVIVQIMTVTDAISNFIYELSRMFNFVEVHTTAGNHSRSSGNKEEVPHGENFDLLVPYACQKDLKNVENVAFAANYLDYDIATFSVRGHTVYATHGDKDNTKSVVYNMTKFARKAGLPLPDMCYLGHRHANGLTTVDDVKVIESGCVDGMDTYAMDIRAVGSPEQTVTVVSEKKRIKALCNIQL